MCFGRSAAKSFGELEKKGEHMELGMIGLGRMGTNMVRRLMRAGHQCVVYDIHSEAVQSLARKARLARIRLKIS